MPFRVVQISDTHLFADPEGELLGVRTRTGTEAVINHIRNEVGAFDPVSYTHLTLPTKA